MNNKALVMSMLMGVIAVFFVQSYVNSIEENTKKKYGTEEWVLKAKKDIKEQDTILENMVEFEQVPRRFREPNSIAVPHQKDEDALSKDKSTSIKTIAGTVAMVPIKKGEQITFNKITEPSIRTGLASQVAPGKRAISIPINDITGVAKLVKPGDRIDLISVMDLGGGKENKIAKTLMQDVVVLAVGRNVTNNAPRLVEGDAFGKEKVRSLSEDASFSTITLEVDPAQVQMLALMTANAENQLSIALRNNDDNDRSNLSSTTYGDVLGADSSRLQRAVAGAPGGRR